MSAIGPKRTFLVAPHMSAFGGKADMPIASKFPLMTQSGLCHRECEVPHTTGGNRPGTVVRCASLNAVTRHEPVHHKPKYPQRSRVRRDTGFSGGILAIRFVSRPASTATSSPRRSALPLCVQGYVL